MSASENDGRYHVEVIFPVFLTIIFFAQQDTDIMSLQLHLHQHY